MRKFLVTIAALLLSACASFGQPIRPSDTPPAPVPAPAPIDPVQAIASFTVNDLQMALADANANGDTLAAPCYSALIQFVQSLPNANSGTTVAGAFSAFQKARDVRNKVQAGVPQYLLVGCGPLTAQVRGDILLILGRLGAGAATGGLLVGAP